MYFTFLCAHMCVFLNGVSMHLNMFPYGYLYFWDGCVVVAIALVPFFHLSLSFCVCFLVVCVLFQGGILSVESLALPPTSTTSKGWVMQPLTDLCHTVQRQRYPPASALAGSSNLHMRISVTLPKTIMIRDEKPLVGWFLTVCGPHGFFFGFGRRSPNCFSTLCVIVPGCAAGMSMVT